MASSIEDVTVVDSSAYDCDVCQCPLRPPIFQCEVAHVVCSESREQMLGAETCHACRCPLAAGGYKRCYGAEHIVEGLRVPCPNKDYGCPDKVTLYDRPFHCPAEGRVFVCCDEPVLVDHFSAGTRSHRWPCTSVDDGTPMNLDLADGFNVILPLPCPPPPGYPQILLLKVTREPYGRVITPIHIYREDAIKCGLKLVYETPPARGARRLDYGFNVPSSTTDISDSGSPDDFVVPKSLEPLDPYTIKVALTCWYL